MSPPSASGAGAPPTPTRRRLRVYAFDPAASVELETAVINDAVIELGWERPWQDKVEVGPVNEYLEVIDYDFPSRTFYEPLDLNDPYLLAQDGLPLSEGRPQFHQQMVFAVAMKTIEDFERALGRPVFWAQPKVRDDGRYYPDFVKRLRIYPHAIRGANAYYSPAKGALLFGYFKGEPEAPGLDAPWVFTCLSADIIAHETTHAILHGMRRRSVQVSNEDSLALHEGFADIVALLQHFTMRRVVEHELGRTGGVLRSVNLLTGLASQFGKATGRKGALRQALEILRDEQRESDRAAGAEERGLEAREQHVNRLGDVLEPHDRGQFLVAAIFDAFVTIYERRTADLFRMAGIAPGTKDGLPEKLVARLAAEACKAANSIMQMCVRGLDYMPPVAPTFGEYLRAIITADTDLYPDDPYKYRVAVAEAFRKRGIPVPGCLSYAPDSLCWDVPDLSGFERINAAHPDKAFDPNKLLAKALGEMIYMPRYDRDRDESDRPEPAGDKPRRTPKQERQAAFIEYSAYRDPAVSSPNLREEAMRVVLHNQAALHAWIEKADTDQTIGPEIDREWERLLGLRFVPLENDDPMKSIDCETKGDDAYVPRLDKRGRRVPKFEVHSVRIARRRTPEGRELQQLVAQVTQKRWGFFDEEEQREVDKAGPGDTPEPDFWFRGGVTIIVDLNDGRLSHIIRKRIDKDDRLAAQRRFILGDETAMAMLSDDGLRRMEPFAFIHGDLE